MKPGPGPKKIVPLSRLPVGRGRPHGRVCLVCRKRQPYDLFNTPRVCSECHAAERHRIFAKKCSVCGKKFKSPSQKAALCSAPCKKARKAETRKARRARRGGAPERAPRRDRQKSENKRAQISESGSEPR